MAQQRLSIVQRMLLTLWRKFLNNSQRRRPSLGGLLLTACLTILVASPEVPATAGYSLLPVVEAVAEQPSLYLPPDSAPAISVTTPVAIAPDDQASVVPESPAVQPAIVPTSSQAQGAKARVPILMYHYIRVNPDPRDMMGAGLSVTPVVFQEQVDWLTGQGYHTVTLSELMRSWRGETVLPDQPIVLTFDDGYQDAWSAAAPVLASHGYVATAFVVTKFVGRSGYLTADQVQSLRDAGWEIGYHTQSHRDLTRLNRAQLQEEVVQGVSGLSALVGSRSPALPIPLAGIMAKLRQRSGRRGSPSR